MIESAQPLDAVPQTARSAENSDGSRASHNDTCGKSNAKAATYTASKGATDYQELIYPEGGVEGWFVVLGSLCAMVSVFGLPNTAAVFEAYFSEHQLRDYTPSQIGWIFSIYLFVTYLVGVLAGPIFDKHGHRVLVAIGSIIMVSSLVILSFCEAYYQLILTFSILAGFDGV
ncbi:riboflavin transporter MCH5 [Colletotrichum orchidophilum]|uniref:Riboflavin transporter MCH5 n=1 Tax=Colletotrichum orchidophilum TaxID=1209926 RepID=A0A1G4BAD3_9PEZI|nr:riboflavin transporter MCH5 [Colletotrichum orchidophilum]OHE98360.1 riboflavin transporter MCH5 [Colletotrichum orchidophilum]